jgi:hypothetical protein
MIDLCVERGERMTAENDEEFDKVLEHYEKDRQKQRDLLDDILKQMQRKTHTKTMLNPEEFGKNVDRLSEVQAEWRSAVINSLTQFGDFVTNAGEAIKCLYAHFDNQEKRIANLERRLKRDASKQVTKDE